MLKTVFASLAALAVLAVLAGAIIGGANLVSIPVNQERYQVCLDQAQSRHASYETCPKTETLWDRGFEDPVAYYTLWLALFTVALAVGALVQSILVGRQISLSRDEFIATHRPKIIVRAFQVPFGDMEAGTRLEAIFVAQNIGDGPATIVKVRSASLILKEGLPIPGDLSFGFKEDFNVRLKSGEKELFPANGTSVFIGNEPMEIYGGSKALYVLGTITYRDDAGTRRETGFCRRYRMRENTWETIKDSEYEYAY